MIDLFKVFMSPTVMKPLSEVLFSGFITQGPRVEEFEKKIGEFINNPLVLTVNSGTSALHLALDLSNGADDAIIRPFR